MRECPKCKDSHENIWHCPACHAAYMREWRKTHPLNEDQRRRDAARSYANVYKKRGEIIQQPCKTCGNPESEMHHPDYKLPLLVEWLCKSCHHKLHAVSRETNTQKSLLI